MTNEQTVKYLQELNTMLKQKSIDIAVEAINCALLGVEKQIPKKPLRRANGKYQTDYKCPRCSKTIVYVKTNDSFNNVIGNRTYYCATCGQALDWSGFLYK